MVCDNVDHHPDTLVMGSTYQCFEVILGSEVMVHFFPVSGPVAVVSTVVVFNDGGDPNSVEAHSFDVVQLVCHSLPCAAAVSTEVAARGSVPVALCKSVSKHLIN